MKTYLLSILAIWMISPIYAQNACENIELNKIVQEFEKELKVLFENDDEVTDSTYRDYLIGIKELSIPRAFLTNSNRVEAIKEFKKTDLFKSIWERNSILSRKEEKADELIIMESPDDSFSHDREQERRPDFYRINLNSDVFNCLITESDNSQVQALFKELQQIGDLSPGIIADVLLDVDDFNDLSVRKYIALQFYVDIIFMVNGLNRVE